MEARDILDRVVEFYLTSDDFNGLLLEPEDDWIGRVGQLKTLVEDELIQVVSEDDWMNPHIRPWSSKRGTTAQLEDLNAVLRGERSVCLYPTPAAMNGRLPDALHADAPYARALAEGAGTLEIAYFDISALEPYRNDPQFRFDPWDFGVHVGIGDAAFLDDDTHERDKIASFRVGFAYDFTVLNDKSQPIRRRVCAFLGDLADLTPEHQRRWETFELRGASAAGFKPHPSWYASQMGNWPDGIGSFEKVIGELEAINELFESAFGQPLFRATERPDGFSWVLRASSNEWGQFVLTLDKLLSDNLRHKALDASGTTRIDENGDDLGTIARLERFLSERARLPGDYVSELIGPWREVRAARQNPAHKLSANLADDTVVRRQSELLSNVGESLHAIRHALRSHPANTDWSPPAHLDGRTYVL